MSSEAPSASDCDDKLYGYVRSFISHSHDPRDKLTPEILERKKIGVGMSSLNMGLNFPKAKQRNIDGRPTKYWKFVCRNMTAIDFYS